MTTLTIYNDQNSDKPQRYEDFGAITEQLAGLGVEFERWEAAVPLRDGMSDQEILDAYRGPIDRLTQKYGFKSVDVINMVPDHPKKDELRTKFLSEHTHSDFEVRFFVDGAGLFNIHANGKVYAVVCEKGDLISVPANTPHWFDMGPKPFFKAIRLFTTPDGWVANFTGDAVADRFPRFE